MKNKYLEKFKWDSFIKFRGLDSLILYSIILFAVIMQCLLFYFNGGYTFSYFPLKICLIYVFALILIISIYLIYRKTYKTYSYIKEVEDRFNIFREIGIYILQFTVLYLMPIVSVIAGFAVLNQESMYSDDKLIRLLIFNFILMIINMLVLFPANRNLFKWQNVILTLLFIGIYLYYYFTNDSFLAEYDKEGNMNLFSIYPIALFVTFVMSFRIGGNFFGMLTDFGYWDKKFNDEFNRKHFSDNAYENKE